MPLDLFQQLWFSNTSLNASTQLLRSETSNLPPMEKQFLANVFWHYLNAGPDRVSEVEKIIDFFCYTFPHRKKSKSQIFQDLWILFQTKEKRNGYFVEFGACDGIALSNTLLLEKDFSWTGILAEPNPVWHDALDNNRDCHISRKCVYHTSGEIIPFSCATIPELSRLSDIIPNDVHERTGNRKENQSVDVETITLFDLLREADAPEFIDYLSIDTEGSEELILKNFDFNTYKYGCITIEHAGEQKKRAAIFELLSKNGYQRWSSEMSRWDDWYVLARDE